MNKIIIIIGLGGLIGKLTAFFYAFLSAYINNNQILIKINEVGEANFELVLIFLLIPFEIYAIINTGKMRTIEEKISDAINYLILLEGLLKERRNNLDFQEMTKQES